MIHETRTNDLVTYTVEKRKVKEGDPTSLYKSQKDRESLRNWLRALLKENDVMIFYIDEDDGKEKFIIGTNKGFNEDVMKIPVIDEDWLGEIQPTYHHVPFISVPDQKPLHIHLDDITKFVLKNDKIIEISNKTVLF
jgi:hypothetical protein